MELEEQLKPKVSFIAFLEVLTNQKKPDVQADKQVAAKQKIADLKNSLTKVQNYQQKDDQGSREAAMATIAPDELRRIIKGNITRAEAILVLKELHGRHSEAWKSYPAGTLIDRYFRIRNQLLAVYEEKKFDKKTAHPQNPLFTITSKLFASSYSLGLCGFLPFTKSRIS